MDGNIEGDPSTNYLVSLGATQEEIHRLIDPANFVRNIKELQEDDFECRTGHATNRAGHLSDFVKYVIIGKAHSALKEVYEDSSSRRLFFVFATNLGDISIDEYEESIFYGQTEFSAWANAVIETFNKDVFRDDEETAIVGN